MSWRSRTTTPLRHWWEDRAALHRTAADRTRHGLGYLNWWDQPNVPQSWFYRFLQRPVFRNAAFPSGLTFVSVFGRRSRVRKVSGPKVFFTGENLVHYPAYADHLLEDVDLALGFADLDAPDYLRFPLWLTDIFSPDADLLSIEEVLRSINSAGRDLPQRSRFAALIARHDHSGLRGQLADLVANFGPVDYPGKFRFNTPESLPAGYDEKISFLRNYQFNLCPENSDAPGYVTEKIWHAHVAGCVPIYWGSAGSPEPDVLNPAAFLRYDPADSQALRNQLAGMTPVELETLRLTDRFVPGAAEVITGYFTRLEERLLILAR